MKRKYNMQYTEADSSLRKTYTEIKYQHDEQGHRYIETHWERYVSLLTLIPDVDEKTRVLEVGASILSAHLHTTYGCPVTVLYHEIEKEWKLRFEQLQISAHPVELMRDHLPVEDDSFDLILFNEVMEHFPLKPDFFMRQLIKKLSDDGELFFSVPNFATSEKRLQFLCGKNPQDPMDEQYIYYAHHREPVMHECIDLVRSCGGDVFYYGWYDLDGNHNAVPLLKRHLFHLWRLRIHPLLHLIFPPVRNYLLLRAKKMPVYEPESEEYNPPLSLTEEYKRNKQ